jgi:signal transduction histidine kinase
VTADRDQLFRVVFNLGQNAIEAMNGVGEVRIVGSRDEDIAVITLADTGPGLPDIARAHLFEPFAGSTRDDGTGLGLSIAREIMRAHGGDIQLAASDADGTVFRLELPAG